MIKRLLIPTLAMTLLVEKGIVPREELEQRAQGHFPLARVFGWKPWDRTTILLKDFADYGNAAALGSPSNMVLLDVAPLSLSMETFSPGERFFTLNNHT